MTTFEVRLDFRTAALPLWTSFRKRIEVPRCYYADLPPDLTYKAEEQREEDSAWRVVNYAEFIGHILSVLFFWRTKIFVFGPSVRMRVA